MTVFFICDRTFEDSEERSRWFMEIELLMALCHELVLWIKQVLTDEAIKLESFFEDIKDGVILCRLANKLTEFINFQPQFKNSLLYQKISFKTHRQCLSDKSLFTARNNVGLFLRWCKLNKIHNSVLFESNDCVESNRRGRREIIICLWQLARKFRDYDAPLPTMIKYEIEQNNSENDMMSTYLQYKADNKLKVNIEELIEKHVKTELPPATTQMVQGKRYLPTRKVRDYVSGFESPKNSSSTVKDKDISMDSNANVQIIENWQDAPITEIDHTSNEERADETPNRQQTNQTIETTSRNPIASNARTVADNREIRNNDVSKSTKVKSLVTSSSFNTNSPFINTLAYRKENSVVQRELFDQSRSISITQMSIQVTPPKKNWQRASTVLNINDFNEKDMNILMNKSKKIYHKPPPNANFVVGDKTYYIRKINRKIYVRVGGGWIELNKFLEQKFSFYHRKGVAINDICCSAMVDKNDLDVLDEVRQIISDEKKKVIEHMEITV